MFISVWMHQYICTMQCNFCYVQQNNSDNKIIRYSFFLNVLYVFQIQTISMLRFLKWFSIKWSNYYYYYWSNCCLLSLYRFQHNSLSDNNGSHMNFLIDCVSILNHSNLSLKMNLILSTDFSHFHWSMKV